MPVAAAPSRTMVLRRIVRPPNYRDGIVMACRGRRRGAGGRSGGALLDLLGFMRTMYHIRTHLFSFLG